MDRAAFTGEDSVSTRFIPVLRDPWELTVTEGMADIGSFLRMEENSEELSNIIFES